MSAVSSTKKFELLKENKRPNRATFDGEPTSRKMKTRSQAKKEREAPYDIIERFHVREHLTHICENGKLEHQKLIFF